MNRPECLSSAHIRVCDIFEQFRGETGPAYKTHRVTLTFDDLYCASAHLLQQMQTVPSGANRRPVLIFGHKNERYPVAYWACLLGGFPLVPIEPDTPDERIRQIAEASNAWLILVASDREEDRARLKGLFDQSAIDIKAFDVETDTCEVPPAVVRASAACDDVAYIMFSSGTLGVPKGIQITYANLMDFVDWLEDLFEDPSVFSGVSGNIRYCFDVSLFEIWMSWVHKRPITALDHASFADSSSYIARLQQDRTGLWVSTPSIVRLMLKNRRFTGQTLPDLHTFLFCGEVLTKQIASDLFTRFPQCHIINTYGPTECTVAVTSIEITRDHILADQDLPIGFARKNTSLETANGKETGEILIRGDSVGRGYLDLPEKQARAFPEPETYRTGDWGTRGLDGAWYFHGRMDREVKIQGVRIDLNDVEAHIRQQEGVEDVVVDLYVLKGEPRALNAYVLGVKDDECLKRIANGLARDLPVYLVPRFWYAGFETALNANCKLDRATLPTASKLARHRHVHTQARETVPVNSN